MLVIAGSEDKCTVQGLSRVTPGKYGERATYVEIPKSDHMMVAGPALPRTLDAIDTWLERHQLAAAVVQADS